MIDAGRRRYVGPGERRPASRLRGVHAGRHAFSSSNSVPFGVQQNPRHRIRCEESDDQKQCVVPVAGFPNDPSYDERKQSCTDVAAHIHRGENSRNSLTAVTDRNRVTTDSREVAPEAARTQTEDKHIDIRGVVCQETAASGRSHGSRGEPLPA